MQLIEKQLERRGSYKCKTLIFSDGTDRFEFTLVTEMMPHVPYIRPTLVCNMSGAGGTALSVDSSCENNVIHHLASAPDALRIVNATASYIAPSESISVSSQIEELEHEVQLLWELLERYGIVREGERYAARND